MPSSINGLVSATGSVYLVNPSGVIVGPSGEIKTGGSFVASTLARLHAMPSDYLVRSPL